MRVQAVVVTFNRLAMLQRLVPRLLETPGLERILVVDNASTDGTGEWLAGLVGDDKGRMRRAVEVKARTALVQLALASVPPRLDPDALLTELPDDA